MIFVDGDIIFTPEDIEKLVRSMQAGYDIIAGGYPVGDGSRLPIQTYSPVVFNGGIQEAKYVSTGFMAISRKALLTIKKTCPFGWFDENMMKSHKQIGLPLLHKGDVWECYPFFENGAYMPEKIYISEDWDFCNKARRSGLKVWFHTGVLVNHCKDVVFSGVDAVLNMQKAEQQRSVQQENIVQTSLPFDLAEYLGILMPGVLERMGMGQKEVHDAWNARNGMSADEFYKTTKAYIMDLANFNYNQAYWQDRVTALNQLNDTTILDIGCGIGTTALYLATQRNTVVGYDLNEANIDFANYRKRKFGLEKVTFTTKKEEVDFSKFAFVVAIDMLEHIENLGEWLKELGAKMKPEARLYHADAFHDHSTPMHFDHSTKIDGWLRDAGFLPLDNMWAIKK